MRRSAEAIALAEKALKLITGADQAQVNVDFQDESYARFARNYVIQHLTERAGKISVAYVKDKRLGTATSGDLSDAGLRRVIATAAEIASRVPPNTEFVSFATKAPIPVPPESYFDVTANASPDARIDKLIPVFDRMKRSALHCSGFTTTQSAAQAVANSLGARALFDQTSSGIEIKAIAGATSGFAEYFSRDYTTLDSAERAEHAAAKATVSQTPQDFPPGTYTVVLEPPAFVDCLNNVLGAMDIQDIREGRDSWMIGRIGKQIFSPNLSIVDDWSHPLMANAPFDADGAPTQKVTLIENGTPKAYVTSTFYANKYHVPNTGHSGGRFGLYPTNAVVMPGTKSREELIASVERGILISRTWYTRVVDPRQATITGLTRDGVFLIENGKLTKTLKNFRFFTSMLSALADVELGKTLYLAESADTPATLAVPDARIGKFTLSAQTSFA